MNYLRIYNSPVGKLKLISDGEFLIGVHFQRGANEKPRSGEILAPETKPLPEVARQLNEYFRGTRTEFDVPVRFIGTPFQVRAWEALQSIPFGETISYKKQAERVGSVPRAVGLANGQNPIAIVVPCHRVIGADGHLVGYGGGLNMKKALLNFEAAVHDFGPQSFSMVPTRI
jgi:methylated-DNA-[protein]-cysteine S-methyltransferase